MNIFQVIFHLQLFLHLVLAIWPRPLHLQHGSSVLWLAQDVQFHYRPIKASNHMPWWHLEGLQKIMQNLYCPNIQYKHHLGDISRQAFQTCEVSKSKKPDVSTEELLRSAFKRLKETVFNQNFVPSKFYPRDALFEPDLNGTRKYVKLLHVEETNSFEDGHATQLSLKREAYTIDLLSDGHVWIKVASANAALHAFETFAQLFYMHSRSKMDIYTPFAPLKITDQPAFEHRGLNLDISRNRIFPDDVMRVIGAMASNKLNKLHIHASDAQSWPLDIPALPDLARKGAYDISQIWSARDLEEIQRHGALHGVEVFVEIDLPGHTTSIGHAYPSLIAAANQRPWSVYAAQPPAGQLKLNSPEVYTFITTLLQDLLPRLQRFSKLFHLGFDEINSNVYNIDPTVNSTSSAVLQPLLQSLTDHILSLTKTHQFTPIVWEEALLEWNLTLPKSTIIQTWRSTSSLARVLSKGHQAIFGSQSHWYLGCGFGALYDPADPSRPSNNYSLVNPPYADECGPYKNWRLVYSYSPLADIPTSQRHLVLGGEVHMWGEQIDSVILDGMLWPRAGAAAEVLWSGPGRKPDEETTRRLAEMRERLVARGVAAGMVTMEWCLKNKGGCTI
jgi:hexosaminidase